MVRLWFIIVIVIRTIDTRLKTPLLISFAILLLYGRAYCWRTTAVMGDTHRRFRRKRVRNIASNNDDGYDDVETSMRKFRTKILKFFFSQKYIRS